MQCLAGVLLLVCGSCARVSSGSIATLAVPGRANANVSFAAAEEFVAAAWSASEPGGSMDIYLSVKPDAAQEFSAPVRVNTTPGTLASTASSRRVSRSCHGRPLFPRLWWSGLPRGNLARSC